MRTKPIRWRSWVLVVSAAALVSAGGAGACAGKFELDCPPDTVQVGGGDVDDVCVPVAGMGGGGGAAGDGSGGGGSAAGFGGAPSMGSGGQGGGGGGAPDEACESEATRCTGDVQQACTGEGKWGEAQACDIACDGEGKACVVPVQLAAGRQHVCARLSDGTVRCWGRDNVGQLGNGADGSSARPVAVMGLGEVVSIDVDDDFSCATTSAGAKAYCWGQSTFVAGSPTTLLAPSIVDGASNLKALGAAATFLCALEENGSLECKGRNDFGQLGNAGGDSAVNFVPTAGFPNPPARLSTHGATACAALVDGTVACWGYDGYGQNGSAASEPLRAPTLVAGVNGARDVIVGDKISCALRTDNTVQCWGFNGFGQLGNGFSTGSIQPASFVPSFGDVDRISIGENHICAVKGDRSLWCWGGNGGGELGGTCDTLTCVDPTAPNPYVPSPVRAPIDGAVDVAAGVFFTCALTVDGKVYCWGKNDFGQLGNGTIGGGGPTPIPVRWK